MGNADTANASEISVGKTYCSRGKRKELRAVLAIMAGWVKFKEQSSRSFNDRLNLLSLDKFAEWSKSEVEKTKP